MNVIDNGDHELEQQRIRGSLIVICFECIDAEVGVEDWRGLKWRRVSAFSFASMSFTTNINNCAFYSSLEALFGSD